VTCLIVQLPESEIEAIDTLPKLEELKSSGDTDLKVVHQCQNIHLAFTTVHLTLGPIPGVSSAGQTHILVNSLQSPVMLFCTRVIGSMSHCPRQRKILNYFLGRKRRSEQGIIL
jgi:hypothetical protein